MKRKFKLIKIYPDSPDIGTIIEGDIYLLPNGLILGGKALEAGMLSEFWEEITELTHPIGTKFIIEEGIKTYTLKELNINGMAHVSWTNDHGGLNYDIYKINNYFSEGTWTVVKNESQPIYEVREWDYNNHLYSKDNIKSNKDYIFNEDGGCLYISQLEVIKGSKIHTVRRLHDGVDFTVGDCIKRSEWDSNNCYIKSFYIEPLDVMTMKIKQDESVGSYTFDNNFEHVKIPPISFFDYNGNGVYVGETYFYCWNDGGMNTGQDTATEHFTKTIGNNEVINFKFKEERDSYIEFFSKTLSIDDVMTKLIDNINDVITSKVISEITEILCLNKTKK